MTFTLIVATVDRTGPLAMLLDSVSRTVEAQHGRVQVIVADQNPDERLAGIVRPFQSSLNLVHLRCEKGLSRARNAALQTVISGDVVAFPDDDCLYRPDTLTTASAILSASPELGGVSGIVTAPDGTSHILRWDRAEQPIRKRRIWYQAISVSLFFRRQLIERVGLFDETLGLGAETPWKSGEETDYLLRAMSAGFRLHYDPRVVVLHPRPSVTFDEGRRDRARGDARGMGRVIMLHAFPVRDKVRFILRPSLGALLYAMRGEFNAARHYAAIAKGRLEGVLSR